MNTHTLSTYYYFRGVKFKKLVNRKVPLLMKLTWQRLQQSMSWLMS